jgi:hypothetical protein
MESIVRMVIILYTALTLGLVSYFCYVEVVESLPQKVETEDFVIDISDVNVCIQLKTMCELGDKNE